MTGEIVRFSDPRDRLRENGLAAGIVANNYVPRAEEELLASKEARRIRERERLDPSERARVSPHLHAGERLVQAFPALQQ